MIFDPLYLLFMAPALLLSLWAAWRVKANFRKYSKVASARGITGAQAARLLLDRSGLGNVDVVQAKGMLSDHYNPSKQVLALSEGVYSSASVAALGVAAHEAGHALQDAQGYAPLKLRSALVPTAGIGSNLGVWVMIIGLWFASSNMVLFGALLFSAVVVFQLVTLPVEFDASNRAKAVLVEQGIIMEREREGVDKVLNAAALTYVAAAVSSIMTLLYFLMRAGFFGSRDR